MPLFTPVLKITHHCGTVFADGESIESANIVGYKNNPVVKGTQYKGPQFVAINTGTMRDLSVSGYGDTVIDAEFVTISKLNSFGVNYKDLVWLDVPDDEIKGWYWYDSEADEMVDSNDDTLVAGDGLKVQVQEDAVSWTFNSAGAVEMSGVPVTLVKGTQYLACAVPRDDATLGEINVDGYGDDVIDAEFVTISKLNSFGVNYKDVVWLDVPDDEIYGWYWYDSEADEMVDSNADTIGAGEGLKVQTQESAVGWTITFPPAVKDAE